MDDNQDEDKQTEDSMIGHFIFDRYKLLKKLGSGSFGCIYSAVYEGQYYAIKLENKNNGQNLIENEAYIMSYLSGPGLPIVKSYGYSSRHNILVMELMGKSLEDIFESLVVKKMTVRCVCNIAYQMMEIMEYIHKKHIIHRDIKPDNFVIGRGEKKKYVYLLDFGLAKKYRSSRTLEHYPIVKSKNLIGTARYASINALNGLTQSRRDDLEAIGYVLMYFLRGRLPWQGIPVRNKEERYRKIMEKKMATSAEELCQGFPNEFTNYINYTRNLQYEQDPDYGFLKSLFVNVLKKENCNKTNEISTLMESKYNPINKNRVITTMNNMDNTMNTNISNKNIQNNKSNVLNNSRNKNNNNNNNNNVASNISMHKNVAFNHTNYEGSALKINEAEINNNIIRTPNDNNNNIDINDLNVQKNNYMENNDINKNYSSALKNIDNNNYNNEKDQNDSKAKKLRQQKDNCCCLIF